MLNRREFAAATAWLWSSCAPPLLQTSAADEADDPLRLVKLGINALARAPEMNYFADGHRGAALISAHLMCVDNSLNAVATARIERLFDLNWAPTRLCADFAPGDVVDQAIARIGQTLASGGGVLREVGHDAIFAMHAIKGFQLLPELATRERVAGICGLIGAIKPWRDEPPLNEIDPPPFADSQAAARYVLREASAAIDRFRGYGQGFAGHMLTFGQALIELASSGHEEWAESCRLAFRKYITQTRKGPQPGDRPIKDHAVSQLRPVQAEYWQKRGEQTLGIGHVFKYPYAYYDLLSRAQDPDLERELDAKAWQIF